MTESLDAYTESEEHSMQHPHRWKLWVQKVLDVDIGAWITGSQCMEEADNRVVRVKERTKSTLKSSLLSPPSLAIRNVVLEPYPDIIDDGLHFHCFLLHYLRVKQPSKKRRREVMMVLTDTGNDTCVQHQVTHNPICVILRHIAMHPRRTISYFALHCQIFCEKTVVLKTLCVDIAQEIIASCRCFLSGYLAPFAMLF